LRLAGGRREGRKLGRPDRSASSLAAIARRLRAIIRAVDAKTVETVRLGDNAATYGVGGARGNGTRPATKKLIARVGCELSRKGALATALFNRLRTELLGRESGPIVPLRTLFCQPTIAEWADVDPACAVPAF
jgi:hypothetical protein